MSTATLIRAMLVLIAAYSIVILFSFDYITQKFRGRLEWIYKKYFSVRSARRPAKAVKGRKRSA